MMKNVKTPVIDRLVRIDLKQKLCALIMNEPLERVRALTEPELNNMLRSHLAFMEQSDREEFEKLADEPFLKFV